MKIVIDIDEELYKWISRNGYVAEEDAYEIGQAIKKGTPLPKGHGYLVDIGQCDRRTFYKGCGGYDSLITAKSAFDMLMALPKIIEADGGEEDAVSD